MIGRRGGAVVAPGWVRAAWYFPVLTSTPVSPQV